MPAGVFVPSQHRTQSAEQARVLQRDRELVQLLRERSTPDVLASILARVLGLGAVPSYGLRVRLAPGPHRIRFDRYSGFEGIGVNADIETVNGQVLKTIRWMTSETARQFSGKLVESLQGMGEYYGASWLDHNRVLKDLADALEFALAARTVNADLGFKPIIEVVNAQWVLTTLGLQSREMNVVIPAFQYDHPYFEHLARTQLWADYDLFVEARTLVATMYLRNPAHFPDAYKV